MFNMKDKKAEEQDENTKSTVEPGMSNDVEVEEEIEEDVNVKSEDKDEVEVSNEEENELEETLEKNPIDVFEEQINSLKEENKRLLEENKKLSNESDTIKDRLSRTVAEYDNYRKRTAKEKEGIYTEACEDVLKEMFPVLDNLERAITVDGSVDDLKKGIEMTIRQFNTALEKLNVEEVSVDGEFNPHMHNAVMHIDDEQFGKNQIIEVFQKGYKRGDKVLRYSMVKVAN